MAGRIHPHVEMPTEEQLGGVIEDTYPMHRALYLQVHHLVVAAVPGVGYAVDCEDGAIGYGARQLGYDGWGMAVLSPHKGWVSLGFLRGAELPDPDGLLEGTGALVRHVKLRSAEELAAKRDSVRRLVEAAARANEG